MAMLCVPNYAATSWAGKYYVKIAYDVEQSIL